MFEKLKALYMRSQKMASLSPLQVFFFSAFAKTIATILTYPVIFARANMIGRRTQETQKKQGLMTLMRDVVAKEGPAGLYKVCIDIS